MPDDVQKIRARVVARYGKLAHAAAEGEQVTDCAPDAFAEGCFGAAAYEDTSGLPEAAVRASLGCGNPVAVAALQPGETVLDLGSGGGIDVLLSARRVGPQLMAAGFTQISITPAVDAGGGLHSAIIQALRPAAPPG
jgi:hypothetical protein